MKVLKFGAVWCPGCLVMKPRWKEIESGNPWLQTEYHDFDADKEAVAAHSVDENLPTFIFLDKNGAEIERLHGEVDKARLVELITAYRDR